MGVHERAKHQRRIRHPARNHHVGAFIQRPCDWSSAEIDVRSDDARKICEHLAVHLALGQFLGREGCGQIVAFDHGDADIRKSCFAR